MGARRRRAQDAHARRAKVNTGCAQMRERSERIILISRGDGNHIRLTGAGGKMRDQIVVGLASSVIDISGSADKENVGTVAFWDCILERLAKCAAAKTRIQNPYVRTFDVVRRFPKVTHLPRIINRLDSVDSVAVTLGIEKLQRHQADGPIDSR